MNSTEYLLKKASEWKKLAGLATDPEIIATCIEHQVRALHELAAHRLRYQARIIARQYGCAPDENFIE